MLLIKLIMFISDESLRQSGSWKRALRLGSNIEGVVPIPLLLRLSSFYSSYDLGSAYVPTYVQSCSAQ